MSCQGHKRREEIRELISEATKNEGKEIDSSKKISLRIAGEEKECGLKDLLEMERQSTEWQVVASGGVRVIPVTEFRLDTLPKGNKEGKVEKRYRISLKLSVE